MRVSKNIAGEYWKMWNTCEYRKTVSVSIGKRSNLCEYRKMVESGGVSGKGTIRASIEKHCRRVLEKVEFVQVSKNCPAEYRKRLNPYEYRKTVQVSTGKGSNLFEK